MRSGRTTGGSPAARRGGQRRTAKRRASTGALRLRRARAALVTSLVVGGLVVATQLPIGELIHQRSDLATVDAELGAANAAASRLRHDVASLGQPQTIANIAHQDYGLVNKGQTTYVVLPSSGGAAQLSNPEIPKGDLMPSSLSPYAPVKAAVARSAGSLWHRVLKRLEFWR